MSSPRFPRWAIVLLGLFALAALLLVGSCAYLSRDEPPPDVSDLQLVYRDDIPDDQNAYALLTALAVKVPNPFAELDDEANERLEAIQRGEAWDSELVARLLEDTEHLWPALEQALAAPYSQAPQLNSYADLVPEVGPLRRLALLTRLRALQLAHDGAPDEGAALLLSLLHLGHTAQNSQGVIITWLTGSAIKSIGMDGLVLIEKDSSLSLATRARLIETLPSFRASPSSLIDSFKPEYRVFSNTIARLQKGRPDELLSLADGEPPAALLVMARLPMTLKVNKTRRLYSEHLRELFELVDTDTQTVHATDTSREFSERLGRSPNPDNFIGKLMLTAITPAYDTVISARHHEQSRLSATQAYLAVRAYQQNHDGELPPTLDALVPDYLSAVPLDYYDRAPIRYSREFRAIWSLGRKGEHTVTSADQPVEEREIDLRLP